jgi:hypothetical protein
MAFACAMVVPMAVGMGEIQALSGARIIVSDLQYAQNAAITSQKPTTVEFLAGTVTYKLYNASGPLEHPMTNHDYNVNLANSDLDRLNPLTAVFGTNSRKVLFDELGSPDNGGYVEVKSGVQKYRIDVAAVTGTVTYKQTGP